MDPREAIALLEARTDLISVGELPISQSVQALRQSLPTMEHAAQLVAAVARQLGAGGYVDPDERLSRRIFVRDPIDPEWIVPLPLVEQHFADQAAAVEINLPFALGHALLRDDAHGFTLVGEGVVDAVDPHALGAQLDAADAGASAPWDADPEHNPWRAPDRRVHYVVWDFLQRRALPPTPLQPGPRSPAVPVVGQGPPAAQLDGDAVRWQVVRYFGP